MDMKRKIKVPYCPIFKREKDQPPRYSTLLDRSNVAEIYNSSKSKKKKIPLYRRDEDNLLG